MRRWCAAGIALLTASGVVVLASSTHAAATTPATNSYTLTDLGTYHAKTAYGIDPDGRYVVGSLDNGDGFRLDTDTGAVTDVGFGQLTRVTSTGATAGLSHTAPGGSSWGIKDGMSVVTGSTPRPGLVDAAYGATSYPALWSSATGWANLYDQNCKLDGAIAGMAFDGRPGSDAAHPQVVGQLVLSANGGMRGQGFRCTWNGSSYSTAALGAPGAQDSAAYAIAPDGTAVGKSDEIGGPIQAAVWTGSAIFPQLLPTSAPGHSRPSPAVDQSDAFGINSLDQVVGAYGTTASSPSLTADAPDDRAFVYSAADGMQDLTDLTGASGWVLNEAFGIADDGSIVGEGTINGAHHAFLLRPVSTFDLVPRAITVIQAVQNDENTDDLIGNKDTYAVVRLDAVGSGDVKGVTATLSGTSSALGHVGPITILGGPISMVASTTHSVDPRDYFHELVFQLPLAWEAPGSTLQLTATLNPDHTVIEQNPRNDVISTNTLTFRDPPRLKVDFVSVGYPGVAPDLPALNHHVDNALVDITRMLPVAQVEARIYPWPWLLPINPLTTPGGAAQACGYVVRELEQLRAQIHLPNDVMLVGTIQDPITVGAKDTANPLGPSGGCSYVPDNVAVVLSSNPYPTYVHEMSHAIGRNHVEFCGARGADVPAYPNLTVGDAAVTHGSLHETDYTAHPDLAWASAFAGFMPASTQDVMTYCFAQGLSPSDYTYEALERMLPSLGTIPVNSLSRYVAKNSPAFSVSATIDVASQRAAMSAEQTVPEQDVAESTDGDYQVRLLAADASVLATYQVAAVTDGAHEEGAATEPALQSINTLVPAAAGTARIEVWSTRTRTSLGSIAVSSHAPTVTVTAPAANSTLPGSGSLTVQWNAADADSDPLTYTVLYRANPAQAWTPVAENITGTSADVDASLLPGSTAGQGQLRVVASDGVNTGSDDVTGLTSAARPPLVTITGPATPTALAVNDSTALAGVATDPQDGSLNGAALTWTDSGGTVIGTGATAATPSLAAGDHIFTLTATDSAGLSSSVSVTVHVDASTHRLATSSSSLQFFSQDGATPDPQALTIDDTGSGGARWSATVDNPRISLDTSSGATPATVHVSVNTSGLAPGSVVSGAITITSPDATQETRTVEVSEQSAQGVATTNADAISFGTAVQGSTSAAHTVTLTAHDGTLTLGSVAVQGADPTDFVTAHDGCSNATLQPGQSCSVDVSFSPHESGPRDGELEIADSDSASTWHVSLSGSGTGVTSTATGELVAWGGDSYGQAGQQPVPEVTPCYQCVAVPTPVPGLDHVVDASAGEIHTVALTRDGTVWVWGSNAAGAFGNGTRDTTTFVHPTPQPVSGVPAVTAVAAGQDFTLALAGDGTVWTWGLSDVGGGRCAAPFDRTLPGQICFGIQAQRVDHVVAITGGENVINAGDEAYALRDDGKVWWWGRSDTHSVTNIALPHFVLGPDGTGALTGVVAIAHGLALRSDGTVWAFGAGGAGQLGNGTTTDWTDTPVEVLNPAGTGPLTGVTAIASRNNQRYALLSDGTIVAWGNGDQPSRSSVDAGIALGIGGSYPTGVTLPMPVVGPDGTGALDHVTSIAPELAVRDDGTAWAWGDGDLGGLGDGTGYLNPWTYYGVPGRANPQPVHGVGDVGTLGNVTEISSYETKLAIIGSANSTGGGGAASTLTPAAVAASLTAGVPSVATLGSATTTNGTLDAAGVTATTDWGDGTPSTSVTVSGPAGGPFTIAGGHTYAHPGTFTATTQLVDATGAAVSMASTITVGAGSLSAVGAAVSLAGTEGHEISGVVASVGDQNTVEAPSALTAVVDWGDGSTPTPGEVSGPPGGPFSISAAHTYGGAGTFNGTATVTSADGTHVVVGFAAHVADGALHALAAAGQLAANATTVSGSLAVFADDDPTATADELGAQIAWGDGSTGAGTVTGPTGGPFTVTGSHTFTGVTQSVTITAVDHEGAQASTQVGVAFPAPQLAVTSGASPASGLAPLNATWTDTVTNHGAAPALDVGVVDSGCGPAAYQSGDTNSDGVLAPGETWSFTCSATLHDTGTVTDVASVQATGLADGLGYDATAAATTVTVLVGQPPAAPTGVTAAVGDGQLTISFTPPPPSTLAVDHYTVTCTPVGGGVAISATGTASPITVTGLTNGTPYTCTVTAHNAAGDGPPSTASAATAPMAPWPWRGFLAPLSNPPTVNAVNAGSAEPVKFSLGGARGLSIFAPGAPSSRPANCSTWQPTGASEPTTASGGSGLTYDTKSGTYTYSWQTRTSWARSCRILTVTLVDGTVHTARLTFR